MKGFFDVYPPASKASRGVYSDGAREAGRCPSQCELASWGWGPVQADSTSIYFGVKLMLVGFMNFGQIHKIRFVVVKLFWS